MKRLPAKFLPVCLASSWQAARLARRASGGAAFLKGNFYTIYLQ